MRGLSNLLIVVGVVGLAIVDILSLWFVFAFYGLGWAFLAFITVIGWVIAPFTVGLGLHFLVAVGVYIAGATLGNLVDRSENRGF